MSRKTTIAKRVGASALAVATLASGLSFGAASASAAPAVQVADASAPLAANGQRAILDPTAPAFNDNFEKFYMKKTLSSNPGHGWRYLTGGSSNDDYRLKLGPALTEAEAVTKAFTASTLTSGLAQQIKLGNGKCMLYPAGNSALYVDNCNVDNLYQRFYLDDQDQIRAWIKPEHRLVHTVNGYPAWSASGSAVKADGAWSGSGQLSGSVAFGAVIAERAVVTAKTVANGAVEVRRGSTVVGSGTADANGDVKIAIAAPDKAGDDKLTVALVENGADKKTIEVTAAYGAGVAITDPANNANISGLYTVNGSAQAGSTVTLKVGGNPAESVTVSAQGQWSKEVMIPRGTTQLVATQKSKGANTTTSTVTVNPAGSVVPAPGARVVFDADVAQRASITGTALDGATVTVRDSNGATVGSPAVVNGTFTLPLTGAFGSKAYTITQTIDDVTSEPTTVTADYGQAVEITANTTAGTTTVTGTSSQGAKITLTSGGREFAAFDVTNTNGTFSRTLTGLGQGNIVITATAKSKGALTSTDTANQALPVTPASVTLTSHPDRTFTPGDQVFAGKATPGTTITLNPFGWEAAYASANLTTTVNQFGDWQIKRGLGNTTYKMFSLKQTAQTGVTNELNTLNMRPVSEVGQPADLTVNFTAGDFFTPGQQTFTGRATPGAQVTLNPFGFRNPAYAGYDITVVADSTTGQWSIPRTLGTTTYREVAVKQESPDASKVNLIENIFLAPVGWLGDPADLIDTTQATTHTPGQVVTFTGTARPGTTVTLYPFGTEYPDYALKTTVKATGTWSINRQLGNQVFPVVVEQANAEGKTDRFTHTMTPATK